VLSIQERILEKSAMDSSEDTENELGEGERALVHQICKVRYALRLGIQCLFGPCQYQT
jgi:hypothetical protein